MRARKSVANLDQDSSSVCLSRNLEILGSGGQGSTKVLVSCMHHGHRYPIFAIVSYHGIQSWVERHTPDG